MQNNPDPKTNGPDAPAAIARLARLTRLFQESRNRPALAPGPALEARPPELVFPNIQPNTLYEATLLVVNKTLRKRKITVVPPKADGWSVNVGEGGAIAPGLALSAAVRFHATASPTEARAVLRVLSEGVELEIPLAAHPPGGFLVFDPELDFGFVAVDEPARKEIKIENRGATEAKFELGLAAEPSLSLSPTSLLIQPNSTGVAILTLSGAPVGPFATRVPLEGGTLSASPILSVRAQVGAFAQFMVDESGRELNSLDLGQLLFGTRTRRRLTLVNNSPESAKFKLTVLKGAAAATEAGALQTPAEAGREAAERTLFVSPSSGSLEPYGIAALAVEFCAAPLKDEAIWANKFALAGGSLAGDPPGRSFEYTLMANFERGMTKSIRVTASGVVPKVALSLTALEFGVLPVGTAAERELGVVNHTALAVDLRGPRAPFIRCRPETARLSPGDATTLTVTLRPRNAGPLSAHASIMLSGGFKLELAISGTAGFGATTTPPPALLDSPPEPALPVRKFPLFVIKPVRSHEPFAAHLSEAKFAPDPRTALKEWRSGPKDHEEARQIGERLSGEKLMKIQVGPTTLSFGRVFARSSNTLFFQIKNELRTSIVARLEVDQTAELAGSCTRPQVIPPAKVGAFRVVLSCPVAKPVCERFKYIINEAHSFFARATADVVPPELELSRTSLEFVFKDDSLDRVAVKHLSLTNKGSLVLSWVGTLETGTAFRLSSSSGMVPPGETVELTVTYTPSSTKDQDALTISVEGGVAKTVRLVGTVNESRVEPVGANIAIGTLAVGQRRRFSFGLRNLLQRSPAIFSIEETSLPEFVTLSTLAGRILPEDEARIEGEVCAERKIELKNHEIIIHIRGGAPVKATLSLATIVPVIEIEQQEFDFGEVTFGARAVLPLTLANRSPIAAELVLPLHSRDPTLQENLDCLLLSYVPTDPSDPFTIETVDSEGDPIEGEPRAEARKRQVLALRPNSIYRLTLTFTPFKPGRYEFDLAFRLPGSEGGELGAALTRRVRCLGTNPRFLMEPLPGILEFPKRVIAGVGEPAVPEFLSLILSNPSQEKPIDWRLDISALEPGGPFAVSPLQGVIDPQKTVQLSACFKPSKPMLYSVRLPLYLGSDKLPAAEISLIGEGAFPKLIIDSEEIVLSPVPVNTQASATISLANDGYQNAAITWSQAGEENIPLSVEWTTGSTIGISCPMLRATITFQSPTPISFTTVLVFEDEQKRTFPVTVSGAADNSLLSTYLHTEPGPITTLAKPPRLAKHGSRSVESLSLPTERIPAVASRAIEGLTRVGGTLKSWLADYGVVSITSWPDDLIKNEGSQVYDLLAFLLKTPPTKPTGDTNARKADQISLLIEQYTGLLNFLKGHGASINVVRPQYLLSHKDLLLYYKTRSQPHINPSYYKIPEASWKYYSLLSWNTMFLQILKIFYIGRIVPKQVKASLAIFPESKSFAMDSGISKHQMFSECELGLLKWAEFFARKEGFERNFTNFDKDFSDCLAVSALVENYLQIRGDIIQKAKVEDFSQMFDRLHRVFLEYGIKEEIAEEDFLAHNPVNMLLLIAHLFKTLPFYTPRAVIEFKCALQETLTKEISFSSPVNKTIIYAVKLYGHKNFSIPFDTLKIDSKSPVLFPVSFHAHTSLPASGKIVFKNLKNGKSIAGAVVYELKAEVVSRFSTKEFRISSVNVYELGNHEILIDNPFDKDVDFKITLEQCPSSEIRDVFEKPLKRVLNKKEQAEVDAVRKAPIPNIPCFFLKTDRVSIKKNGSARLTVYYLPLTYEHHKANIIFLDPKVGELQYEVNAKPNLPNPLDSLKFTLNIENFNSIEIPIPAKNTYFSQAFAKLGEKFRDQLSVEVFGQLEKLASSQPPLYEVDIYPPGYLSAPAIFSPGKPRAFAETPPKIVLSPVSKTPFKDLYIRMMVKGVNKMDFRLYDIFLTVLPKPVKATLEIKTTARFLVSQDIPLTNPYDTDCLIKPALTPVLNGHLFEISKEFFVAKKNSVTPFNIKFLSPWIDKAEAHLELFNTLTNDKFEYALVAVAEEPLSEDNIQVVTKAKANTDIRIQLKNPMKDSTAFKVNCDIPGAEYPQTILFTEETYNFYLSFVPKLGGQYLNAITFTDDKGRYFWYLITLKVDPPLSSKELSFTTEIRKPMICHIDIENKTDKQISYSVAFSGDQISGEPTFVVPPQSTAPYNLIYYPSRIEESRKKIGFLNAEEGEQWFDLVLVSTEAKPVKLPTFRTELGKFTVQKVPLKNFLKKKSVRVEATISENSNFSLPARVFEIPPNSVYDLEITFTPRELNKNENEVLLLKSNLLGDWKFILFGVGIQPTDFETVQITSYLGKNSSKTLTFRNPFAHDITVQVYFEQPQPPVFDLLIPKSRTLTVPALTTTQLIFRFTPKEISTIKASLYIKLNETTYWCYPIVGITESFNTSVDFQISTSCGKEIEKTRDFVLEGIKNISSLDTFDYSIKFPVKEKEAEIYQKWLAVKPIKSKLVNEQDKLSFLFTFLPNKPFKVVADFFITRESGGRWRFKIALEASEPEYFDTISIVSQLNVKKSVHFRLFNNDKKVSSPFTARFTQESDSEFTVEPASGTLEPAINDGTLIQINYLPIEYGKAKIGTLVIETETFMWRFLVKGSFGKYVPPVKQ